MVNMLKLLSHTIQALQISNSVASSFGFHQQKTSAPSRRNPSQAMDFVWGGADAKRGGQRGATLHTFQRFDVP